jgi:hypothetical protein
VELNQSDRLLHLNQVLITQLGSLVRHRKSLTELRSYKSRNTLILPKQQEHHGHSTDIMYGVTMIEAGVSRVVPVDLRELA